MSYEKHPEYACEECRKTFKNERALKAHNRSLHQVDHDEPVQEVRRTAMDTADIHDSGSDPVRSIDAPDS